ncbi:MAG: anti-sigma factor antagonist [Thermoanaerobacteraceae bacterium]|nr:anti-sigma factor antagonist [Thermoanaerobacteraceae bacterium]
MNTSVKHFGNTVLVSVWGELDMKVADSFRQRLDTLLDRYPESNLLLDLSGVNFIDSSGLGVILGRYKKLAKENRSIAISGVQPQVRKILELSGIMKIIEVYPSEEDALSQLL